MTRTMSVIVSIAGGGCADNSSGRWWTDQLHGGMGEARPEVEIGLPVLCHDGPEDGGKAVPAGFH